MAIESGFLEYQEVNGNYYGTPRKNLKDGIIIVASDEFKIEKENKNKIILFYIDSPLELRYNRLISRGCSDEEIFHRFHQENSSFLYNFRGCFIDNGDENQSVNQILQNMNKTKYINNDTF